MNTWRIGAILLCVALADGRLGFAQATPSRVFADGAVMAERDPTEFFYGSDRSAAGRAAVGVYLSERNSLRFEMDVPHWRMLDTASSSQVWCAANAGCVGGEGWVPARTTSHTAVRTVSYSLLYARHLQATERVQVAILAGGSLEARGYRSSGSFDELGADGRVLRHNSHNNDHTLNWPAAVAGADVEVSLASHLAVIPQFRFHTFPYPVVSIVRTGVALRLRF
jgi:hypothetical protein